MRGALVTNYVVQARAADAWLQRARRSTAVYMQAMLDLSKLVDNAAPARVIGAAQALRDSVDMGVVPPAWVGDILLAYAAQQQRVNRYGQ